MTWIVVSKFMLHKLARLHFCMLYGTLVLEEGGGGDGGDGPERKKEREADEIRIDLGKARWLCRR